MTHLSVALREMHVTHAQVGTLHKHRQVDPAPGTGGMVTVAATLWLFAWYLLLLSMLKFEFPAVAIHDVSCASSIAMNKGLSCVPSGHAIDIYCHVSYGPNKALRHHLQAVAATRCLGHGRLKGDQRVNTV